MDLSKLYGILAETTIQLRKGEVLEGSPNLVEAAKSDDPEALRKAGGGVLEIYAMPAVAEAPADLEMVDVHFVKIGVDKAKAEARRSDLLALLDDYPDPERLAGGPSYIEVGAAIGDQGAAFQLFALGKALGIWDVITPEMLGATGDQARQMAGSGFIMCTGYRPAQAIEAGTDETAKPVRPEGRKRGPSKKDAPND